MASDKAIALCMCLFYSLSLAECNELTVGKPMYIAMLGTQVIFTSTNQIEANREMSRACINRGGNAKCGSRLTVEVTADGACRRVGHNNWVSHGAEKRMCKVAKAYAKKNPLETISPTHQPTSPPTPQPTPKDRIDIHIADKSSTDGVNKIQLPRFALTGSDRAAWNASPDRVLSSRNFLRCINGDFSAFPAASSKCAEQTDLICDQVTSAKNGSSARVPLSSTAYASQGCPLFQTRAAANDHPDFAKDNPAKSQKYCKTNFVCNSGKLFAY